MSAAVRCIHKAVHVHLNAGANMWIPSGGSARVWTCGHLYIQCEAAVLAPVHEPFKFDVTNAEAHKPFKFDVLNAETLSS